MERNEELRFFIRGIGFLARGGFVGLVIEMKKGADDVKVLMNEASALFGLGNYRAALEKLKPALAASHTSRDEANAVNVHLRMLRCHAGLEQVSWRRRGLVQKLTSLSHSTQTYCASVTSWSRC